MSKIVMALDQGTTSSRTILFNESGKVITVDSQEFPAYYPHSGWVEQKAEDLWNTQKQTITRALEKAGLSLGDVTALGITNQRETTIAWDKTTGKPIYNAIVWQCRRTAKFCEELKAENFDQVIKKKTGLVTDAYFSGTKMRWILENVESARQLAQAGKLAFGTVDSWLIWNLTQGEKHVIDATNASRTLVYNIFENQWDQEILDRLTIPLETLPTVVNSSGVIGVTNQSVMGAEVPIAGVAGDQQASLFGQACFEAGMAKNTYGTGCFLLMNTGEKGILSENGLLTTIAWQINGVTTYALEGAVFIAGAVIQWLRDELQFFQNAKETQAMAESVATTNGVYLVPAFVGLGAPYWDPYARGTLIGLSRNTNRNHITRAALEAIAYQSYDVFKCMESDTGESLTTVRVDGGATANDFLCQFQADILNLRVSRPQIIETTAMGAAFLAGLATGVWKDQQTIQEMWKEERLFQPQREKEKVDQLIQGWKKAIQRSQNWMNEG